MSRRRRSAAESLDALLDTMTNVVGILILILVMTHMGVGQAVQRIRGQEAGAGATSEREAEDGLEAARNERARLEQELASLEEDPEALARELAALRRAVEEAREAALPPGSELASDEAEALIEQREQELAELEKAVAEARRALSRLRAEAQPAGAEREVTFSFLPDAKPPPDDATRVRFVCRYKRCLFFDGATLGEKIDEALRAATGLKVIPERLTPSEVHRAAQYFGLHMVGNDALRMSVSADPQGELLVQYTWRNEWAGESSVELARDDSDYRKMLLSRRPELHYIMYYVWPDSFEAYYVAREIATEMGFAAGWVPVPAYLEFVTARSGVTELVD